MCSVVCALCVVFCVWLDMVVVSFFACVFVNLFVGVFRCLCVCMYVWLFVRLCVGVFVCVCVFD